MTHASEPARSEAEGQPAAGPFAVIGTDDACRVLRGTGDPVLDARGHPGRVIHVEILDAETGRTWLGSTRDWVRKGGVWFWSLDVAHIVDTAEPHEAFGRQAGAFDTVAYFEQTDPATGRIFTVVAEPRELTLAEPQRPCASTDSVSAVLARIREMGEARPTRGRLARSPALNRLPEDRFIFVRRPPVPYVR